MITLSNKINSPNFCSKPENESFDDEFFQECRNSLREHYTQYVMPYSSIYEREGQLSDYQINDLIGGLGKLPEKSDYENIEGLPLRNLKKLPDTENSYRGQTLASVKPKTLKTLKNSGIKTVVDLIGYEGLEDKLKKSGIKYFPYKMAGLWNNMAFDSRYEYIKRQRRNLEIAESAGINIDVEKSLEYANKNFNEKTRGTIDNLTDFINTMRNDNVYISCQYGTYCTDVALILNDTFNPKRADIPIDAENIEMARKIGNLYDNLTPQDKIKMGWDKEVDSKVFNKILECEKSFILK